MMKSHDRLHMDTNYFVYAGNNLYTESNLQNLEEKYKHLTNELAKQDSLISLV